MDSLELCIDEVLTATITDALGGPPSGKKRSGGCLSGREQAGPPASKRARWEGEAALTAGGTKLLQASQPAAAEAAGAPAATQPEPATVVEQEVPEQEPHSPASVLPPKDEAECISKASAEPEAAVPPSLALSAEVAAITLHSPGPRTQVEAAAEPPSLVPSTQVEAVAQSPSLGPSTEEWAAEAPPSLAPSLAGMVEAVAGPPTAAEPVPPAGCGAGSPPSSFSFGHQRSAPRHVHSAPAATPPPCDLRQPEADISMEGSEPDLSTEELGWEAEHAQGHAKLLSRVQFAPPAENIIGRYRLLDGRAIGDGGLGAVYRAVHTGSNAEVALKLGSHEFVTKLGSQDFTWWTWQTEWNCYNALNLGQGADWMPQAYETGLLHTGKGIVPWITMELLGPSLHALMRNEIRPANIAAYAHGMLSAVESLHCAGFVHRDIKPANFVTQQGFQGGPGKTPSIVLLDFGFAQAWDPITAHGYLDFCGTPDFASIRSLRSNMPGPADDVEAVAYSLLQLWMGEMPWDITQLPKTQEAQLAEQQAGLILSGRTRHGGAAAVPSEEVEAEEEAEASRDHTSCGWSEKQLKAMATRKEQLWARMVQNDEVPRFLVDMVEYAQSLPASAMPCYAYLHALVDRDCGGAAGPSTLPAQQLQEQAVAAAAAKAAAGPSRFWGAEE